MTIVICIALLWYFFTAAGVLSFQDDVDWIDVLIALAWPVWVPAVGVRYIYEND